MTPDTSLFPAWNDLRRAALLLTSAEGFGAKTLRRIRTRFPDLATFLRRRDQWNAVELNASQRRGLAAAAERDIEPLLRTLEEQQISFLLPEEEGFPELLQRMDDAPFAVFVRGAPIGTGMHVAMVGTRTMTDYGNRCAQFLAGELARYGVTVVSGFALGIDMASHRACVEAGGATIAVLPCGIDDASVVPRAHSRFAAQMLHDGMGTFLSEYPPGTRIFPHHFLLRNRLIAALSQAIIVVEGDHDSGALVTARSGVEIGREVLAVPGSIFASASRGTNSLIRDGARMCRTADDVFAALGLQDAQRAQQITQARREIPVTPQEERVLEALNEARSVDELSRFLQQPAGHITAIISLLELKGRIISVSPRTYIRTP